MPGGEFAPSHACVLKTVCQPSTTKPSWGVEHEQILLPEQMLINEAEPDATLLFEAWDLQTTITYS